MTLAAPVSATPLEVYADALVYQWGRDQPNQSLALDHLTDGFKISAFDRDALARALLIRYNDNYASPNASDIQQARLRAVTAKPPYVTWLAGFAIVLGAAGIIFTISKRSK